MHASRRKFIVAAAGAAATLSGCTWLRHSWPEQGLFNPCHTELPTRLAQHEAMHTAWEGIDAAGVWDCHAHLIGTGDSGSGVWLNPDMYSVLHPIQFAQRLFYLNAGCADAAPGRVDERYIERMRELVEGMPPGCKLILLAFDRHHSESGAPVFEDTPIYVPDEYVMRVARRYPQHFEWAASIHPYRRDAVRALEIAAANGARAVKWLPAAMGIDPASPRCDLFYRTLAALDLPLITHGGMERAMRVGARQALGNPLRLRRALDQGVRVVIAHCATMGEDQDLDRGENGPYVASFALFARLMDDTQYHARLYGDLSAVTQWNRAGPFLRTLIERDDWHARLLNGSDYPLPGVMPMYSVEYLVEIGLLAAPLAPVLTEIRKSNALLFDFVLKRHLRASGKQFAARVFETRAFFERPIRPP